MDESRDKPAEPEEGPRFPLLPAIGRLSPVQQAYSRYVTHATGCAICRDVDRGPCGTAEELWQVYRTTGDNAFRALGRRT